MPAPISGNSNALPPSDGVDQTGAQSTPTRDAGAPVRATDGHPRASAALQPQSSRSTAAAAVASSTASITSVASISSAATAASTASVTSVASAGTSAMQAEAAAPADHSDAIRERLETIATLAGKYEQVLGLQHQGAVMDAKHVATINALEHAAMAALAHGQPQIAELAITQLYDVGYESSDVRGLEVAYSSAAAAAYRLVQAVARWRAANESAEPAVQP